MKPTYILNVSGGHGHFLQWILDKFCVDTPPIEVLPYNHLGASHLHYNSSNQFIFIDDPETEDFLNSNIDKNAIMITIDDEILYWERSCMYRAGDAGTDLFDEKSIEKFLNDRGSTFPKVCRDNSMSIKDGYRYAFQDINNSGARIHDNKRKNILGIKNTNVYFLSLKNFINKESFKNSLLDISKQFGFAVDLSTFDKTYDIWYNQNTILQTHDAVEQHQNGNTSIKLDVLQQAYVDAQQN